MDIKQVLTEAWGAVEAAGVPEHVQAVALEQAVRLLMGDTAAGRTVTPGSPESKGQVKKSKGASQQSSSGEGDVLGMGEEAFFRKFAEESDVDADTLRSIYFFKDGQVRLGTPRRLLGDSEAERNRTVALLTVAARWYVEGNPSLTIGEVRDAAKAAGYEPTRNLGKHLDGVPGTQAVGLKTDKAVRVQSAKFDAPFRDLIQRLIAK